MKSFSYTWVEFLVKSLAKSITTMFLLSPYLSHINLWWIFFYRLMRFSFIRCFFVKHSRVDSWCRFGCPFHCGLIMLLWWIFHWMCCFFRWKWGPRCCGFYGFVVHETLNCAHELQSSMYFVAYSFLQGNIIKYE